MGVGRFVRTEGAGVWTGDVRTATDEELVGAARRGDPEAFSVIYRRYKLDTWHLAWFTLRDHHEAEDALQETWVKAHRSLGQCRDASGLRPWLLAICRNVCRDRARSARRRETVPLDEELFVGAVVAVDGDRERALDFHRALAALPSEDREAFFLVDVLGCRSEEAAQIAGLAASSTLRSRVARARRALAPAVGEPVVGRGGGDVWGVLQTPQDSVIVVSPGATGGGAERAPARGAAGAATTDDLLRFLDRLDDRIPVSRRVLAVLNARPASRAAVAAPWLADHPRWNIRRAPTHALWLGEVDDLLGEWPACSASEREAVRSQLAAGAPCTWTWVS